MRRERTREGRRGARDARCPHDTTMGGGGGQRSEAGEKLRQTRQSARSKLSLPFFVN